MKKAFLPAALLLVIAMSGCSSSQSGQNQNQNQNQTPTLEGTNCGTDFACLMPLSESCAKA